MARLIRYEPGIVFNEKKNLHINFIIPGTDFMNGLSGTIHPTMAALQKRRAFFNSSFIPQSGSGDNQSNA
jgi:hypothetical protein